MEYGQLKVFGGRANTLLAKEICSNIGITPGEIKLTNFADKECRVQILENVRGADCFVVQPTSPPVNDNLMELLVIMDALTRASASRITAVIPYYGYGRQDKKDEPRVPITSRLVADLITISGANRVLTMDLHASQIQGFFRIPVDHLYARPVFLEHIKKMDIKDLVVVSPDTGGAERARSFAKRIPASMAIADKRRPMPNKASIMHIIGKVKDKNIIILDDIVDTAGTLVEVAKTLKIKGAKDIYAACTHGVLSADAVERINKSPLKQLMVSDSIDLEHLKDNKKIKIVSVAKLLGEAIIRAHNNSSINDLFL
jgi:ribose-phosphate pyrophosphokinase